MTSYATSSLELDGNSYAKLFAMELAVACFSLVVIFMRKQHNKIIFNRLDLATCLVFATYLFACRFQIFNFFCALTCLLLYLLIRTFNLCAIKPYLIFAPIAIILHICICILQVLNLIPNFNDIFHVGGSFGNPDMLGAFLAMLLPACYLSKRRGNKHWNLMTSLVCLITLFLLQCRTAIVASVVTYIIFLYKNNIITGRKIIVLVLCFVVAFCGLVLWHPDSFLGRIYIWIVAINMILSRPLGWGIYAFDKHYMEQQARFTMEHPNIAAVLNFDVVDSPYNEFFRIGIELGIIALLIYLVFVFLIYRMLWRNNSLLFYPFMVFQILSLAYFPLSINPVAALYVLICAIAINRYCNKGIKYEIGSIFKYTIAGICFVCSIVVLAIGIKCYSCWNNAVRTMNIDTDASSEKFIIANRLMNGDGRFLITYAQFLHNTCNNDSAILMMHKAERIFTGIKFLQKIGEIYEVENNIPAAKECFYLSAFMSGSNKQGIYALISFLCRNNMKSEAKLVYDKYKNLIYNNKGGILGLYYIEQTEKLFIEQTESTEPLR